MSTSSHEKLLKLAHQRAIDGKGGLAASVAKLCLDTRADLSPEELELTYEILRKLINQVEVQIRRYIADYLAERADVPADLLTFLTHDVINVAYPMLVHSRQLSDDDLIEISTSKGQPHAVAIAKRAELSADVTRHLVDTGDTEVLMQLLKNFSATIDIDSFAKIAVASATEQKLQTPLVQRRDLPPELAKKIYTWVGESLRTYILEHFEISSKTLDDAVTDAIDRILESDDDPGMWEDPSRIGYGQRLIGALDSEGDVGFVNKFAEISGVDRRLVSQLFDDGSGENLAIACKAYEVSKDDFNAIAGGYFSTERLGKGAGSPASVMKFYNRLDLAGARMVVRRWRDARQTLDS